MADTKAAAAAGAAGAGAAAATPKTYTFIVEHLENFDDSDWCRLEYEHINYVVTGCSAPLVAAKNPDSGNRFVVTNITPKEARQLQPLGTPAPAAAAAPATKDASAAPAASAAAAAAATADAKAAAAPADAAAAPKAAGASAVPIASTNGFTCYSESLKDIHSQLTPVPARVCVLDMRASQPLRPSDCDVFDTFVFGGVLGDHPPKDRAKMLRELGFTTRSLGPRQMTTDSAVLTCQLIVSQRTHHAALLPPAASSSSADADAKANSSSAFNWEPHAALSYVTAPAVAPFVLTSIPWVDDPEIETGKNESTSLPFRYVDLKRWRARHKVLEKLRAAPAPTPAAALAAVIADEQKAQYVVAAPDEGEPLLPAGLVEVLSKDLDLGLAMTDEDIEREMMHAGRDGGGVDFDFGFGEPDDLKSRGKPSAADAAVSGAAAGAGAAGGVTVSGELTALGRELIDLGEAELQELNLKMMNGMTLGEFDAVMAKLGVAGAGAGAGAGTGAAGADKPKDAAAKPAAAAAKK